MLSPATGPAVLHRGNDLVSLYVQTASSLWKSSLHGLASSHVLRLTLSGTPKILLYCTEYRRPTTDFQIHIIHIKVTGQVKPALKEYWGRATAKTFLDQKILFP
jgi:hypothetical protein